MSLDSSRRVFSKYQNFIIFLIHYSRYLSSKLYIDMRNKFNCVKYYGTEGVVFTCFSYISSFIENYFETKLLKFISDFL